MRAAITGTQVQSFSNARVMPVTGAETGPLLPGAKAGVFQEDGSCVQKALLWRHYAGWVYRPGDTDAVGRQNNQPFALTHPADLQPAQTQLEGEHIFAGYLFDHFGHFLLESLARLWYWRTRPEVPVLWVPTNGRPVLHDWQRKCLDLLGVVNPVVLLEAPTRVAHLTVPDAGYAVQTEITAAQAEALQVIEAPTPQAGKKVWLSRSKLDGGRFLNDAHLERLLSAAGWDVYHAQDHSLRDQLTHLSDAERVAGVAGSALHLLALIKGFRGRVDVMVRGRMLSSNFTTLAAGAKIDQHHHYAPSVVQSDDLPGWRANYRWLSLTPVLKALSVSLPPIEAPVPERVREAERVLLISDDVVAGHKGLVQVCAARRHASQDGPAPYDMTGEDYFLAGLCEGEAFDRIVIDHAGGADQVRRLALMAEGHIKPGGQIWARDGKGVAEALRARRDIAGAGKVKADGRPYQLVELLGYSKAAKSSA